MATAMITTRSGLVKASISELRPNSVLVNTEGALGFRESVSIDILGVVLEGEVVFAGNGEAAIAFATTPEVFELIEAIDTETAPSNHGLGLEALGQVGATLPVLDDGTLRTSEELDALAYVLTLAAGRAILARSPKSTQRARLVVGPLSLELHAVSIGGGIHAMRPKDLQAVQQAAGFLRRALDRFETGDIPSNGASTVQTAAPKPAEPPEEPLPALAEDGTVRFTSLQQYQRQYGENVKNGALIVRSPPIPASSEAELSICVPGHDVVVLTGTAMFQGDGTVGFAIAPSDAGALKALTSEPRRERPAAGGSSAPQIIPFAGKLRAPLTPDSMMRYARPLQLKDAGGRYFAILDYLIHGRHRAVVKVEGEQQIMLWVYQGHIVFSTRVPAIDDDQLGRRLLTKREIKRTALEAALKKVTPTNPLGAVLLDGVVRPEALHKELRAQTLERTIAPASWTSGQISVAPWREPAVKAKLVPLSGPYALTQALREQCRALTSEEIMGALVGDLTRTLSLDLEKMEDSFRLEKKEQRFFTRLAQNPTALGSCGSTGGASQLEALRLAMMGAVLGFATLGEDARKHAAKSIAASTQDLLVEQLEEAKDAGPFDILGIHWTATNAEIERAYGTERKKLLQKEALSPDAKRVVAKLIAELDAARATLRNPSKRKALRIESTEATDRRAAADHLLQQAEFAILRESYEEAIELLDTADEIHETPRAQKLRKRFNV